jgi:hypothetical protein
MHPQLTRSVQDVNVSSSQLSRQFRELTIPPLDVSEG